LAFSPFPPSIFTPLFLLRKNGASWTRVELATAFLSEFQRSLVKMACFSAVSLLGRLAGAEGEVFGENEETGCQSLASEIFSRMLVYYPMI
jgi:hypothetical protein